jgi:hypothetical protein
LCTDLELILVIVKTSISKILQILELIYVDMKIETNYCHQLGPLRFSTCHTREKNHGMAWYGMAWWWMNEKYLGIKTSFHHY